MRLGAVVLGGLLAMGGGILTTLVIEHQKRKDEAASLALAFKGEIGALIQHVEERNYLSRTRQLIEQMEQTGEPFFMRIRIRWRYDRVYENNVERLGLLAPPLPERIPLFYTRLSSIVEDFVNPAEETYAGLDLPVVLLVYADLHRLIGLTLEEGTSIIREIEARYQRA